MHILVRDFTIDWAALLTNWRTRLIEYIRDNLDIVADPNTQQQTMTVRNKTDITNFLVTQCQTVHGSKIYERTRNVIVDSFSDESNELLSKIPVLNQEVDFTEYTYDIKVFKVVRKSAYGDKVNAYSDQVGSETLAYHIEIFNVGEPNLVYKYRLPVRAHHPNDPLTFIVDVFNLIDHVQNL